MDCLAGFAALVGFVASVCTIVLFVEDRAGKFRRRRERGNKMMRKKRGRGV